MVALGVDKQFFLDLQQKIIKESTPKVLTQLFSETFGETSEQRSKNV